MSFRVDGICRYKCSRLAKTPSLSKKVNMEKVNEGYFFGLRRKTSGRKVKIYKYREFFDSDFMAGVVKGVNKTVKDFLQNTYQKGPQKHKGKIVYKTNTYKVKI